jgi:TonB family protein
VSTTEESIQKKPVVLIGFVALSLLAHGSLFLLQPDPQSRLVKSSLGTQKLSISLISSDTRADTKTNISSTIKTQTPRQIPVKIATEKKPIQTIAATHKLAPAAINQLKRQPTPKITQRNFLLGEIKHHLSRYLNYPVRAQRRGWQGEVMVGFHVDKQGFLHNVHLAQTSGYSLLDNAALSAIGKIKNIPLSSWLENNHDNEFYPTALQLPVSYRLTNS